MTDPLQEIREALEAVLDKHWLWPISQERDSLHSQVRVALARLSQLEAAPADDARIRAAHRNAIMLVRAEVEKIAAERIQRTAYADKLEVVKDCFGRVLRMLLTLESTPEEPDPPKETLGEDPGRGVEEYGFGTGAQPATMFCSALVATPPQGFRKCGKRSPCPDHHLASEREPEPKETLGDA